MEHKIKISDKSTSEIMSLSKLIAQKPLDDFLDILTVCTDKDCEKVLLYPTEDVLLTEEQFHIWMRITNGEHLYATEVGETGKWYDMEQPVYCFNKNDTYEHFSRLPFWSISVFFDETYTWTILIDEAAEGGIGLLQAPKEMTERFKKSYPYERDIDRFKQFYCAKMSKKSSEFAESVLKEFTQNK